MKKAAVFALLAGLALFAVVSQGVASAPRLSMWNRGLFNLYSSDGTTSVGPSWMGPPTSGPFNDLGLDWSAKDVSWTMTAMWDGDGSKGGFPIYLWDYAGSYSLFDGRARVTAGKVWSGGDYRLQNFDTTGFSTRIANAETGVLLQVYPLKGLSLGGFLPVPVANQNVTTTWAQTNLGIAYAIPSVATFVASCRLERNPALSNSHEYAVGASIPSLDGVALSVGFTYRDTLDQYCYFADSSYGIAGFALHLYGDFVSQTGGSLYGAKFNAERSIPSTPFVGGLSILYGNEITLWYFNGFEINPYLRYDFGGSSVQLGFDGKAGMDMAWSGYQIQLSYTISFP